MLIANLRKLAGWQFESFKQLDWNSPASARCVNLSLREHGLMTLLAALAVPMWFLTFPDANPVILFLSGLASGAVLGKLPGLLWQISAPERRPKVNGRYAILSSAVLYGFFLPAIVFSALNANRDQQQVNQMKSLQQCGARSVTFSACGESQPLTDAAAVDAFMHLLADSAPFVRSHEIDTLSFQVTIVCANGEFHEYLAGTPEHHPQDIIISPGNAEMILSTGAKLIEPSFKSQGLCSRCCRR